MRILVSFAALVLLLAIAPSDHEVVYAGMGYRRASLSSEPPQVYRRL